MLLSRRSFISGALSSAAYALPKPARSSVVAGAIRWDGWYEYRDLSIYPQQNLRSNEFVGRAPIHCVRTLSRELNCLGEQGTLDNEILEAERAGLTYWAFCWFPQNSSFRRAWLLYQSSKFRNRVKWCAIVSLGTLRSMTTNGPSIDEGLDFWVELLDQSEYLTVTGDGQVRPVIFLFYRKTELENHFRGDLTQVRTAITFLRSTLWQRKYKSPYVVIFNPALDIYLPEGTGSDAISNYIGAFRPATAGKYADLELQIEHYWYNMKATNLPMVPIAQIGWDVRPRNRNPVPWDRTPLTEERVLSDLFYEMATPEEFENHLRNAVKFIDSNPLSCRYRLLLIYSWNECDEGGCMMPTLGDPSGHYLDAATLALGPKSSK